MDMHVQPCLLPEIQEKTKNRNPENHKAESCNASDLACRLVSNQQMQATELISSEQWRQVDVVPVP